MPVCKSVGHGKGCERKHASDMIVDPETTAAVVAAEYVCDGGKDGGRLIPSQPERLGRTAWCSGSSLSWTSSFIVARSVKHASTLPKGCGGGNCIGFVEKSVLRPVNHGVMPNTSRWV